MMCPLGENVRYLMHKYDIVNSDWTQNINILYSKLELYCRYRLNRVPVEQRVCETCNVVEDEYHVVMDCKIYDDIRDRLFTEICGISFQFRNLSLDNQFLQIMSNPQFYRAASRAMHNILNRRRCNMLK